MKAKKLKKALASLLTITLVFTLVVAYNHINASSNNTDALHLNKTAVWNNDGTATIKLESYATGKVTSSTLTSPTDIVLVLDVSGSMQYSIGKKDTKSKLQALKDAANLFIMKTAEKNKSITDSNQKHRISIVKYAGKKSDKIGDSTYRDGVYTYNYSQIVKDLTLVDGSNEKTLTDTVKKLGYGGATSADYGLEHAQTVLKASPDDRNQVVIMFTDGEPNHQQGFDATVAKDAINLAKKIKTKATLYSISVLDGANPSDIKGNQNKYMNAVSSNYPNASASKIYDSLVVNFGTGGNKGFYKKATEAEELEKVFEEISEEIGSSGIDLGSSAVLTDYISDYFQIPDNANVKVHSESYNGPNKAWTKNNDQGSYSVQIDKTNKKVNVTGFDYSKNYVLDNDPQTNKPTGKKLVVEITVKPIDGFIGGNKVVTNKKETAIYSKGEMVKEFPFPNIDVPIQYKGMTNDATIHIGDQWNDLGTFIQDLTNNKVQYKINNQEYAVDGIRNAYVDIIYTIKDKAGETVGTYKVNAGQKVGALSINSLDTSKFVDCQNYNVNVSVSPINKGTYSTLSDQTLKSTLHVLKPSVNLTDIEILFGERTDLTERVSLQDNWDCGHKAIPAPTTTPELTYSFVPKMNNGVVDGNHIFTPEVIDNTDFSLIVKNHQTDITNYTKFNNTSKKETKNIFTVYVKAGNIQIEKRLVNTDKIDLSDGDPIFTFKITGQSIFGQSTYYQYVRYSQLSELNKIKSVLIEGLPVGQYTVEELDTLRYTFDSVLLNKQTVANNHGKIAFDINGRQPQNVVSYTNKTKSDDYFSDNDVLVNKFVKENGQVVIKQDKLDK